MSLTRQQAEAELRRFRRWRVLHVLALAARGTPDAIHGTLLLALSSRETGLRNIIGGGSFVDGKWVTTGVDRGLWQINAYWQKDWLRSVPGCESGTYEEVYRSALPEGRVPGLTRSCLWVINHLREGIEQAKDAGIPDHDCVRVAVAGHNQGTQTAIGNYKAGDVDSGSTGKNYSADVLKRQHAFREALRHLGWV